MTIEELIYYRDEFNKITLKYQKENKKWNILTPILLILGVLLVIIPAMIVGDNNGQQKPIYFYILVILGVLIIGSGLVSLIFQIYHLIIINKNKSYRDQISHELTYVVSNKKQCSDKTFDFIKKVNK